MYLSDQLEAKGLLSYKTISLRDKMIFHPIFVLKWRLYTSLRNKFVVCTAIKERKKRKGERGRGKKRKKRGKKESLMLLVGADLSSWIWLSKSIFQAVSIISKAWVIQLVSNFGILVDFS